MLAYLLDRLERVRMSPPVAVATSRHASDDAIAAYCAERGTACTRGPLDDVAGRFLQVLDETRAEAFVRVSGDSPLLDPALIDRAIALFQESDADLASNVRRRTFPKGMSVEVVRADAFRRALADNDDPAHREHVTTAFYADPDAWKIVDFQSSRMLGEVQLSVDTEKDFAAFEALLGAMTEPHWSYGLDALLTLRAARGQACA